MLIAHPVALLSLLALFCLPLRAEEAGFGRWSSADPLNSEVGLPTLRAAQGLASRVGELPCANSLPERALAVLDVVDLTLCNNPQTRETWAYARAQAAQLGGARGAYLPSLEGKATASRIKGPVDHYTQNTASLTLSWLLFDFGARSANLDNAQALLQAALATQDATVQAVFLQAIQAYHAAQAAQAARASALEAEKASQASLAAAEVRYQVGTGTPADQLQARTAYSQAVLNRIKADGEARNALGVLANVMGFEAAQRLELAEIPLVQADARFERAVAEMIDEAKRRRPDLQAAAAQVVAARASVDSARANGLPTLSVAAGPTWQELRGTATNGGSIGLSLNLPLFSGYGTTYKVRAAEAQVEAKLAQQARLERQVALEVWKAYQGLQTATQALRSSADLQASAEQSAKVALGRYQAGVGNVLDVLNAQSALASARLQRIQAGLDWQVWRATLAQAMGVLDYSAVQGTDEGKRTP